MNAYEAKITALGQTINELLNGPIGEDVSILWNETPAAERTEFLLVLFPEGDHNYFLMSQGAWAEEVINALRRTADRIEAKLHGGGHA